MANANALNTLRGILHELRLILPKESWKADPSINFVLKQYRQYQVTPSKVCRNPKAASHQAATYLCYLQSNRKYQELLEAYKGKGERSIEESARLVGLNLPKTHDP